MYFILDMIRLTNSVDMWESSTFTHPIQTNGSVQYTFNHNRGQAPIFNKLFMYDYNGNGVWSLIASGRDWAHNGNIIYRYDYIEISANTSRFTLYRIDSGGTGTHKIQLFF